MNKLHIYLHAQCGFDRLKYLLDNNSKFEIYAYSLEREDDEMEREDDEWAKDCCIICIAIKPGAKNFIKWTPRTSSLLSPIARVITSKNKIEVIIVPITVFP
mgnify:CR=1 FL=1